MSSHIVVRCHKKAKIVLIFQAILDNIQTQERIPAKRN